MTFFQSFVDELSKSGDLRAAGLWHLFGGGPTARAIGRVVQDPRGILRFLRMRKEEFGEAGKKAAARMVARRADLLAKSPYLRRKAARKSVNYENLRKAWRS